MNSAAESRAAASPASRSASPTSSTASAISQTRPRVAPRHRPERRPAVTALLGAHHPPQCRDLDPALGQPRRGGHGVAEHRPAGEQEDGQREPQQGQVRVANRERGPPAPAHVARSFYSERRQAQNPRRAPRTAQPIRRGRQGLRGSRVRTRPPRRRSSPPAEGLRRRRHPLCRGTLAHLGCRTRDGTLGRSGRKGTDSRSAPAQAGSSGAAEYIRNCVIPDSLDQPRSLPGGRA